MKRVKLFFIPAALLALPLLMTNSSALADTTNLSVTLDPVLSIRVVKAGSDINTLTLNVEPTASGRFIKDDLSVLVSTSNETGYTLTMSGNDADTAMHHTESTITATIPSITTSTDEVNFPINSWAYSLGDISSSTQQFSPIPLPTSSATIKTTAAPTTEDSTNVTFAAKINTALPAGTYQDTIVFSATTNYVPRGIETITRMQDITPALCAESSIGAENILTDTRDNKTYVVRKLKDGRCWMVQNLALGGTSPITLTPADSNVSANFTLSASSNSFGTTNDAAGIDINRMYDNGNTWLDGTTVNTTGTPPSQTQYMGNYYNWYTATAGSGTYATSTEGDNALQSICPKGWRLPTGGAITSAGNGEFQKLYDAYGNATDFVSDASAIPSGFWYDSFAHHQGSYGFWWSRTASGATSGYDMAFDISNANPQNYVSSKRVGNSVRCVAENQDLATISTMQQMTPSVCAATKTPSASETTVPENTLTDTRDNKTYTVRKLADGNCWMVKNLDLDLSTAVALDSVTSDLSPGRTWTPQNSTQTTEGTAWVQDGGDVAKSMDPGNIYFPGGVGTGTPDSYVNLQGASSGEPWEFIGNYYNWYAATAGTGTAAMTNNQAALNSICPKGWKLPDNWGDKSFQKLMNVYGIANDITGASEILQLPLNFVRSGYYGWGSDGRVAHKGNVAYWWSSVAQSAVTSWNLNIAPKGVIPQNYDASKGSGLSVRCIAK